MGDPAADGRELEATPFLTPDAACRGQAALVYFQLEILRRAGINSDIRLEKPAASIALVGPASRDTQ